MKTDCLSITALSDQQLIAQVVELARREREATAGLVAHLAEFGTRKLYLGEGCATLFTYCTEVLHLSEHETYLRITAARLSRRFPVILDRLQNGAVNLTTLKLLRKVLTSENHARLLAAAERKTKREVEELVASVAPKLPVEGWIRKLPAVAVPMENAALTAATPAALVLQLAAPAVPANASPVVSAAAAMALKAVSIRDAIKPAVIAPLAPELYKIQFTATAETRAKLRRAQDLMRHQIPTGDPAAIIDRALTMLVAHLEKTRLGATDRPRTGRPRRKGRRYVPTAVRRAVSQRDGGRCAFTSADGRRCSERGFLQFHHVHPHGDGGEPTVENIALRCRAHNEYEGEMYFGDVYDAAKSAAIRKHAAGGAAEGGHS